MFWIKIIVSVVSSGLLLLWVDWQQFGQMIAMANGYWLLGVFIIIHIDRLFMVYKWTILLRRSGGMEVSIKTTFQAYYVGSFWAAFLPSSVGGDVARMTWLIKKKIQHSAQIISSVVIERLLGALALAIVASGSLAIFTMFLDLNLPGLLTIVFLLLFVTIITVTAIFNRSAHNMVQKLIVFIHFQKVSRGLKKVETATMEFKDNPILLLVFLILSILEQFFPIISNFMLAKAFSINLSIVWAIIGVPIIMAVSRMPITVDGWGVQEGAYVFIFSFAGVPLSEAVMMSITGRILLLFSSLPGSLWTISASKDDMPISAVTQTSDSIELKKE